MFNLSPTVSLLAKTAMRAGKTGVDGMADKLGTGFRGEHSQPGLVDLLVYLLAAAAVIAVIVLVVRLYARAQRRYQKQPRWLFEQLCNAHGLRRAQRRLLWQVAREQFPENPIRLFLEPGSLKPPHAKFHRQSETDALTAIGSRLFCDLVHDSPATTARAAAAGATPLMPIASRAGIDVSNLLIATSTRCEPTAAN
jgi:hypothetical protein